MGPNLMLSFLYNIGEKSYDSAIERNRLRIPHYLKGVHQYREVGTLRGRQIVDGFHGEVAVGLESAVEQVVQKTESGTEVGIVRRDVEMKLSPFAL